MSNKKKEIEEGLEKLSKEANFGGYKVEDLYRIVKRALEESIFQSSGKRVKLINLEEIPDKYKTYDIAQKFRKNLRQSM
ncbi:MAG: hypothetical protein PWQ83_1096 [Thermosipho sp. (in: thermotogales)]|nr:hypothetical protein [Thermosipho sp. (in: thermotogales)]